MDPLYPPAFDYTSSSSFLSGFGCASVFVGIPAIGLVHEAYAEYGMLCAGTSFAAVLALPAALGVLTAGDTRITADDVRLRVAHVRRVGPFRGRERVDLDVAFDAVHEATEIRRHRTTKHGEFTCARQLSFGKLGVLEASLVGGTEPESPYHRLVAFVRTRLGERFSELDDFGTLDAAMKRRIADEVERQQAG